jgi:histidinol-phosphate/aromatic aminotransferase/cobyric acid decarboxylase-like protein
MRASVASAIPNLFQNLITTLHWYPNCPCVELEAAIAEFLEMHNQEPKPFVWTRTADEILETLAHFCKRPSNSAH